MRESATATPGTTATADGSSSPPVSVVLLTYNRGAMLERSLRSLFAQTHRPLQIVVVDDASNDDTPDVIRALVAEAPGDIDVTVRTHATNLGIGQGRNTGIDASTGRFVAFTDDDCEARPDWVSELVRPFEDDERIAATGGGVDEPPDRTWSQAASEGINFLGTTERDVRSAVGCNMAFRREFLERVSFDPTVRYGADELDVCFTAAAQGLRVRFTPAARVTHHHRRTVGAFLRQQYHRGKGSVWVRRKHRLGTWPNKNWVILLLLAALAAIPLQPAPRGALVAAAALVLFLAQTLYLDLSTGKPIGRSLYTFPLVVLGYVAEFLGAALELVRGLGRR